MDWADKIIAKRRNRGDNYQNAEQLRQEVQGQCDSNIERWQGERQYRGEKLWEAQELEIKKAKETKRLARLKIDQDKREQFKWDYEQKGIYIEPDYSQIGKIASVRLPFSDTEWCDLLNKEGEYLPSCCAEISRIRDILQDACREDHSISVEDFYEAVFLARHHGWNEKDEDPIARMIVLWERIKDDVRDRSGHLSAKTDDPKDALEVLYQSAGTICWDELFSKRDRIKDTVFDSHKNRGYALATIQSAVRTLFYKLKELDPGPIEGYGVVREDGEIGQSRSGLAVYRTPEFAQEVCDRWNKTEQTDWQERDKRRTKRKGVKKAPYVYSVKKVRVSMERGVEYLPEDHVVKLDENVERHPEEHPAPKGGVYEM